MSRLQLIALAFFFAGLGVGFLMGVSIDQAKQAARDKLLRDGKKRRNHTRCRNY